MSFEIAVCSTKHIYKYSERERESRTGLSEPFRLPSGPFQQGNAKELNSSKQACVASFGIFSLSSGVKGVLLSSGTPTEQLVFLTSSEHY